MFITICFIFIYRMKIFFQVKKPLAADTYDHYQYIEAGMLQSREDENVTKNSLFRDTVFTKEMYPKICKLFCLI